MELPYSFAQLMRDHGENWRVVRRPGEITATHKTAVWPNGKPVVFTEPDPEALHEQLADWEEIYALPKPEDGQ